MNDILNLAYLLRENGDQVLNGRSKLSLTVTLLKSLNEAFATVADNNGHSSSFEVIHSNSSKVETFQDVTFLYDFIQRTVSLKLTYNILKNESSARTIDICKFKELKYLELRKVPINIVSGIQSVRAQLQSVVCIRCVRRLKDLLLDCGADHCSGFMWNGLREAVFSYNGIDVLDHSLEYVPWLQILDLSHNRISNADTIDCLPNLKYLNMSFNLLESSPRIHRDARVKLQVLIIKNNYIEDLSGLLGLESLMELDLSCNCLSEHDSLKPLLYLPGLSWLSLEGNPLSFHHKHRSLSACNLHDTAATTKFILDRLPLSKSERLLVGSLRGGVDCGASLKDKTPSAESSSALERTVIAEKRNQSKQQLSFGSKKGNRVREVVISEQSNESDTSGQSCGILTNSIDLSSDHLETKKQIETIRHRFGEDNWLHSHAGSCVQGVLGLHKIVLEPSPMKKNELSSSPENEDAAISNNQKNEKENIMTLNKPCEEITTKAMKEISSPDSLEVEETEEEEDESEKQLYLVQRHQSRTQHLDEFFLIITERWIKEREILHGKTLEKWTVESLLSCIRTGGKHPVATVHLTFDTVRRERQERLYIMDEKDAQRLIQTLGKILDSRSLSAMNQIAFRCMKCSTQFCQEHPLSGIEKNTLTCPTCNSTLVIELDEVPLPSHYKENQRGKESTLESSALSSGFTSSPSQLSIGKSEFGTGNCTGVSTMTDGSDKLQVTAVVHKSEVQQPSYCSAASLDPSADSPNNNGSSVRRWDSDIEIISNPSQSSIEVLEEQTRLQGVSSHGNRKCSEERQIISVTVPTSCPESNNNMLSAAGLTESSSSGSLTDSICTTYEIHSSSVPTTQDRVMPRVEDINVDNKMVNDSFDIPEHEKEKTTIPLSEIHKETLSPHTNYAIMLEGLLHDMGSKLTSKSPDSLNKSQLCKGDNGKDKVKYSFSDFSLVDHRVKLYLYLHVFQQEQEEFVFLVRAHIIYKKLNSWPGLFVTSTKNVYILQIKGDELDDPEKWLMKVESHPIGNVVEIFPLLWEQGICIELLSERREQIQENSWTLFLILQDQEYTKNFFTFLSDCSVGLVYNECSILHNKFKVNSDIKKQQHQSLLQLLDSSYRGDDSDILCCIILSSYMIQRNEETSECGMGAIIITTTDIILTDNMDWLTTTAHEIQKPQYTQKMSNLIEVRSKDVYQLTLNFLDEAVGLNESWIVTCATASSLQFLVSVIKTPWEKLFSVPLSVINSIDT